VAIGKRAGYGTQGGNSVAVGYYAGYNTQSGNSVAIGNQAGVYTQGGNSVAIGNQAGYAAQGGNSVAIGNQAGYTGQGKFSVAIGNCAGVKDQSDKSIIINATDNTLNASSTNACYIAPIRNANQSNVLFYNTTNNEITYDTAPSTDLTNLSTKIKTTNIIYCLGLDASNSTITAGSGIYVKATGVITASGGITASALTATGAINAASFNATSDRRLKKNIVDLGSTLEKIIQLKPKEYIWENTGVTDFGFIAQDYYRIFPELKPPGLDGEEPLDEKGEPKYYSIDYGKITCFLTKSIHEILQRVQEKGFHGISFIPENNQSVNITFNQSIWSTDKVYIVQITPINRNMVFSSSYVEKGQFTVYGEPGKFYWSVFPQE